MAHRGPLLGLLAWIALTTAAGCASPPPRADQVRVRVASVGFDPQIGSPVVVLVEEEGSGRELPIWIGPYEARSIALAFVRLPQPRPNAHDLLAVVLEGLGGHLARVVITELRAGTYYAELEIERGGRTRPVDARPSDAIALALRTGAPLFSRGALLNEPSRKGDTRASAHGSVLRPRAWR